MRLSISILGTEVFAVDVARPDDGAGSEHTATRTAVLDQPDWRREFKR